MLVQASSKDQSQKTRELSNWGGGGLVKGSGQKQATS